MSRLLAFAALIAVPTSAHAFAVETVGGTDASRGEIVRWAANRVEVELNADGAPSVDDGSDLAAVRRALASWNGVSCSALVLADGGASSASATAVTESVLDEVNRLTWIEDARWGFGSQVLAVTAPIYDTRTGEIVEADIAFNGLSATWSTDGNDIENDVEAVAVHELGHLLGLQHVLGGNALAEIPTMAPAAELDMRSLSVDDASGACFLYPRDPYACSVDCDCPTIVRADASGRENNVGQLVCESGRCVPPSSSNAGGLGSECFDSSGCESPLFCQPIGLEAYCARDCVPEDSSTCPDGLACFPYSNAVGGACLPEGAGSGAGGAGEICQAAPPGAEPSPGEPGVRAPTTGGPSSQRPSDPCPCDTTTVCDGAACACDPECADGGCSIAADQASRRWGAWLWVLAIPLARRRRGRPRFGRTG